MKKEALAVMLIILLAPMLSIAADPISNIIDAPVPIKIDGSKYAIEEVKAAIIQGCQSRDWSVQIVDEGTIRAKLNIDNKHFAEVNIPYSESAYSIVYASSENLDYNERRQRIHRNYNRWVVRLSSSINQHLQKYSSAPISTASGRGQTSDDDEGIFDELLKLDELRDKGILTDEEFEVEKRKLLDRN